MKKLFLAFILSSNLAQATDNLNFDSIRLNELAKLAYTQILETDFIADNDFNNDTRTASVYLKNKTKPQIKATVNAIIKSSGYDVSDEAGVVNITKRIHELQPDLIPFYYKPKYRDVSYLTDMVSNIFKTGAFTFRRPVQATQEKPKDSTSDTGTNAYAQISKPQDAFIFNGTKQENALLEKLLMQLDTPENQVQITAYLYEVTNTDSSASSFSLAANVLGGVFKLNLVGQALSNTLSFGSGNFQAGISALASDSRFNVISSPQLLVKNRQKGSFSVGAEVPILGQVSYQNNGQPVQSVEYKPSGVILDLTPTFHDDDIELTIHHQISNFVQTTTGVNSSPTLIKRELNTVVNSRFEDIILLGGLSETKDSASKSGLPFLPNFLRSNSTDKSKSDILLLLHVKKI